MMNLREVTRRSFLCPHCQQPLAVSRATSLTQQEAIGYMYHRSVLYAIQICFKQNHVFEIVQFSLTYSQVIYEHIEIL